MEFGREVYGDLGNVTQAVSYAPNMLIKLGAKLVVNAEDVIEELPTPVRAALVKAYPRLSNGSCWPSPPWERRKKTLRIYS